LSSGNTGEPNFDTGIYIVRIHTNAKIGDSMSRVEGKVAIITGGARGIGAATARKLMDAGAMVVITDVLIDQGEETAAALRSSGGDAVFASHDVTKEEDWKRVVGVASDQFGGLDILVNNAGIVVIKKIEETTLEELHKILDVNLAGVFLGVKFAAPTMREAGENGASGGSIINLSSVAGIDGVSRYGAYCMTKGGVRIFTKAAAMELARDNIRVNSIHPGLIQTDMGGEVMSAVGRGRLNDNEVRVAVIKSHPIGRLGVPDDIANGVLYLASDVSSFVTGTELVIDGGVTAG
jgi:NAD(P)-dependent dehydrogenase (short-subunit alcohol dehydrogenase family)